MQMARNCSWVKQNTRGVMPDLKHSILQCLSNMSGEAGTHEQHRLGMFEQSTAKMVAQIQQMFHTAKIRLNGRSGIKHRCPISQLKEASLKTITIGIDNPKIITSREELPASTST